MGDGVDDDNSDIVKEDQDNSISNYLNTINRAILLCDDEPSPESSDDVFFICEEQKNIKCDDKNESNDKDNKLNNTMSISLDHQSPIVKADNDELNKKKSASILCRKRNKKSIDIVANHCGVGCGPDEDNQNTTVKRSIGLGTNNDDTQTAHTIVVKIQVENCSQCPDNSLSLFKHDKKIAANNDNNQCKLKTKTVAVQVNFNSIESVMESHCVKISKVRCCNKATRLQSINKGKKSNTESIENDTNPSAEMKKIYLWNGKNFKNQTPNKTNNPVVTKDRPKLHDKSNSVDRATFKSKKSINTVSPHKKFNRSSLTIGPDKITVNQNLRCYNIPPPFPNLSKYSPCASRLAASSKILGNTSPTALSPDSPLHVARPKSPRIDDPSLLMSKNSKSMEKMPLQASLSLNIQQLKKSHLTTPRSRSVGDSCVTSPTSEATTLSYSPTGTEILSLDEIGQQTPVGNNVSLSAPDLKAFHNEKLTTPIDVRKANLETKC
ncbi:hypothetical protein PV326_008707 [Microctonus aethiopoides]|nr:hypothetical protein PV326_008707 [Microctonus aethiopoides]